VERVFTRLGRKTVSLLRKPLIEQLWLLPAALLLGAARAALLLAPFRRIAPLLGRPIGAVTVVPLATPRQIRQARHIGCAIRTAACYTPWESTCLPQAITARIALGISGIPYALYLGVNPSGPEGLVAHAWVCTGLVAVTGGHAFHEYAIVGTFASAMLAKQTLRARGPQG
jgi:hypothetical protein